MHLKLRKRQTAKETLNLPEIQAARNRLRRRLRILFALFVFGLLLIAFAWLIFRSPVFRIKEFHIEGAGDMETAEIKSVLYANIFHRSHLRYFLGFYNILTWPSDLHEADLRVTPLLKGISIDKSFWRRSVVVRVEMRRPVAVWCFQKNSLNCYWFDEDGIIIERSLSVEGNLIRKVSDNFQAEKKPGAQVLPGHFLSNFFSILKVLDEGRFAVTQIALDDLSLQEMKVALMGGPNIYFSLRFPALQALPVLNSMRSGEYLRGKKFAELEYVDFRSENRAYFK